MDRCVLDSNIYIEMKNGPYGFDIVPGFWAWIEREAEAGTLYSPRAVYEEISRGDDDLAAWFKARSSTHLFVQPDAEVQAAYRRIADRVVADYEPHQASDFLSGADPWVIAQAQGDGAIVVTHEHRGGQGVKRVLIPNLCDIFGLRYIKIYDLLRARNFRL